MVMICQKYSYWIFCKHIKNERNIIEEEIVFHTEQSLIFQHNTIFLGLKQFGGNVHKSLDSLVHDKSVVYFILEILTFIQIRSLEISILLKITHCKMVLE